MTRAILALYDLLTPFNLRVQTFRVNLELLTYYYEHSRKKNLSRKVTFGHFFRKEFGYEKIVRNDLRGQNSPKNPPIVYESTWDSKVESPDTLECLLDQLLRF